MKAHLLDSDIPILEGSTVTANCGKTVAKVKFVMLWDGDEIGHTDLHLGTFCHDCADKLDEKWERYLYGIIDGQEFEDRKNRKRGQELKHGEG